MILKPSTIHNPNHKSQPHFQKQQTPIFFTQQSDSVYDYPRQKQFFVIDHNPIHQSKDNHKNNQSIEDEMALLDMSRYKYKFDCFDISKFKTEQYNRSKPQPFMGAFFRMEHQFSCFDIKLGIPSMKQYPPFSNVLSFLSQQKDNQSQQSQILIDRIISTSSQDQQISAIEQNNNNCLDQSIFNNFQSLLIDRGSYKKCSDLWDQNERTLTWSRWFEFHNSNNQLSLWQLQQKIDIFSDKTTRISDQELVTSIAKMLQGIQSEQFTLDYHLMAWSVNINSIQLEHSLRISLPSTLQKILQMANHRSRIQSAIQYISKHDIRKVYIQLSNEIKKFLIILQEIILQKIQNQYCLIEFISQLQQTQLQLSTIYGLLLNDRPYLQQKQSFFDFNHTFLNSQYIIYNKILRLSKMEDNMDNLQNNTFGQIFTQMLVCIFRPIVAALSNAIFQQNEQISTKDQHYLQFYLSNAKNLSSFVGRKILMIKQESNQLYLICKRKLEMKIVKNHDELKQYQLQWTRLFHQKRKSINEIKQKQRLRKKQKQQKEADLRFKGIYQLKKKMVENIQSEKKIKSEKILKSFQQAQRIKEEIAKRQEQRRLTALIQKEKEKGYLLQQQLNEKKRLQMARRTLMEEAERLQLKIQDQKITTKSQRQEVEMTNSLKEEKQIDKGQLKNITGEPLKNQQIGSKLGLLPKEKIQNLQPQTHLILPNEKLEMEIGKSRKSDRSIRNKQMRIRRQIRKAQEQQQSHSQSSEISSQMSDQSNDPIIQQNRIAISNKEQKQISKVNTATVLDICIDLIIEQQMQITHLALGYIIYEKYQLLSLLDYLKNLFMGGKGDIIQEFLTIAVNNTDSVMDLRYFRDSSLFDQAQEFILNFTPHFYNMKSNSKVDPRNFYGSMRLFNDQLQSHIGFEFRTMPIPLQPYFNYIHLGKYIEIFGFILRLKHSTILIAEAWKQLNSYKTDVFKNKFANQQRIMNKLFATRYIIQCFINTFQNYLYFRVIQKEQKSLRNKLNQHQINQLSSLHLKMLDNIIRNGFISNPHNQVSKKMKDILGRIRQFKNIIDMFCVDDVPSYLRDQLQAKVDHMTSIFKKNQEWFQNLFFFS